MTQSNPARMSHDAGCATINLLWRVHSRISSWRKRDDVVVMYMVLVYFVRFVCIFDVRIWEILYVLVATLSPSVIILTWGIRPSWLLPISFLRGRFCNGPGTIPAIRCGRSCWCAWSGLGPSGRRRTIGWRQPFSNKNRGWGKCEN